MLMLFLVPRLPIRWGSNRTIKRPPDAQEVHPLLLQSSRSN